MVFLCALCHAVLWSCLINVMTGVGINNGRSAVNIVLFTGIQYKVYTLVMHWLLQV